ncbi:malonate decarboxylase holo-[acyl-carrier-protein] synthase [Ramlibacter alkalitolerans]|nr:malonate decarboxylase holo-[acyl-carrier-protein] synthase [Ramlibacter alkalitolerans]
MTALLRRHQLVWLSCAGWQHLRGGEHAPEVAACLAHWCEQRLPLVVGRQEAGREDLALGLAAPIAWGRRKIALRVPRSAVLYHDRFPRAGEVSRLLPLALRARWSALQRQCEAIDVHARVHGSFGWQAVTRLRYLMPASDIDLLLQVPGVEAADAVASRLAAFEWAGPRIDGELIFPDGSAVAWREWLQWRSGNVQRVMVKRLYGVGLEQGLDWLERQPAVTA